MNSQYEEMAFSLSDGIFPKGSLGVFKDEKGFLYTKSKAGKYKPINPMFPRFMSDHKKYSPHFTFECDGVRYTVLHEDIDELGIGAGLFNVRPVK